MGLPGVVGIGLVNLLHVFFVAGVVGVDVVVLGLHHGLDELPGLPSELVEDGLYFLGDVLLQLVVLVGHLR